MKKKNMAGLSRRERQIMDILFGEKEATGERIMELVPDPPSYSAIRSILRILEDKGYVGHRKRGRRYLYYPVVNREQAKRSALRHILKTFFDDSPEHVVAALMDVSRDELSDDDLARMAELIAKGRKEEDRS